VTRIKRNNINYNLRYDGYYLSVSANFWAQWLKFQPNATVGYTHWSIEEILGKVFDIQTISRSEYLEILHKFILERYPWVKESDCNPYTATGKYKIQGTIISFEINDYNNILRIHENTKFKGRILNESLDLEQLKVFQGYENDVLTSLCMYEFVAFKF
jgi:hypothetical protein